MVSTMVDELEIHSAVMLDFYLVETLDEKMVSCLVLRSVEM